MNAVNTFADADHCIDYVTDIQNERVFMIVSGTLASGILPCIHGITQLEAIYIYCTSHSDHEWIREWPKVKGVFTQITTMCESLQNTARHCDKDSVAWKLFSGTDAANKNVDQLDKPLIHAQPFKWVFKSNTDPFSKCEPSEWCDYSDVENEIIEEAFTTKKTRATLDNYYIDFELNIQIAIDNGNHQRPVKRLIRKRNYMNDKKSREERFMPNPISPKCPFSDQYGWVSVFMAEVRKNLKLRYKQMPSQNKAIVPMLVEKAALGIIEEGKKAGKQFDAEWMAKQLMKRKESNLEEVWKCCARLYTMDSFLYRKLNETMRLIGSTTEEHIWRNKICTWGPFCLLLWSSPFGTKPTEKGKILYRGADLSDAFIATFIDKSEKSNAQGSFQAFTSSTRNRTVANAFSGTVLFIMRIVCAYTIDLSPYSQFPEEEEELIFPGVSFTVDSVDFHKTENKHLVYLDLNHRHTDVRLGKKMQCCSAISDACADFTINYGDDNGRNDGLHRDTGFLNLDSRDDNADLFDLMENFSTVSDEELSLCRRMVITRKDSELERVRDHKLRFIPADLAQKCQKALILWSVDKRQECEFPLATTQTVEKTNRLMDKIKETHLAIGRSALDREGFLRDDFQVEDQWRIKAVQYYSFINYYDDPIRPKTVCKLIEWKVYKNDFGNSFPLMYHLERSYNKQCDLFTHVLGRKSSEHFHETLINFCEYCPSYMELKATVICDVTGESPLLALTSSGCN